MKKECFTCKNKIVKELTKEEGLELKKKNNLFRRPMQSYTCGLTNKVISQIDPACEGYVPDDLMVDIRKELSRTIHNLTEEINRKK